MKKVSFVWMVFILTSSCNTSKITSVWQSPHFISNKYKKILVIGLVNDRDRATREKMETHFVDDLKLLGCTAISALAEYGPHAFEHMDEHKVLQQLQSSGVDAVITIVLLEKKKELGYGPTRPYQNRFWGYYDSQNSRITAKDYYVVQTKYFWESNFYELQNGQLLYSVQTSSFNPASAETMGHEFGKMIVEDMIQKKILLDDRIK